MGNYTHNPFMTQLAHLPPLLMGYLVHFQLLGVFWCLNQFKVNSTLHMVGTMGNSYKPHPTCRAKEMGTLTDWEVVEGPQIRVEGEVLQR